MNGPQGGAYTADTNGVAVVINSSPSSSLAPQVFGYLTCATGEPTVSGWRLLSGTWTRVLPSSAAPDTVVTLEQGKMIPFSGQLDLLNVTAATGTLEFKALWYW